jgi:alpha-D-xyloside xylohydrolase
MQLAPYLLSAFERYALDGTPPFRALAMDYPKDKNIQFIDDQYMIGDRMFVAPLFAGEAERQITVPPGEWHDFWTGEKLSNHSISVPRSTDKIPVFVKTGSVVPLATVGPSSLSAEARQLVVHIYGEGQLPWRMSSPANGIFELSWDAVTGNGRVQSPTNKPGPYHISEWRHMR